MGQTVQKLQHFLQVQDGGRRHLGFWHKFKFDQTGVQCVTGPIWRFNWVKIDLTVQKLQHFLQIRDGGLRHLGFWHKFKFDQTGV